MVMFKRLAGDLYVEPQHHQDPGAARVAFYARTSLTADEIDPIHELPRGCFLLFPRVDDWRGFAASLPQAVGQLASDVRIGLLTANGVVLSGSVRGAGIGSPVQNGSIIVGVPASMGSTYSPPTGNERWRIVLSNGRLQAEPSALRVDFATVTGKPGLRLDQGTGSWIPLPAAEQWIRLPLTGADRGLWQIPSLLDQRLLDEIGAGPAYFEPLSATRFKRLVYPLFDLPPSRTERFEFMLDLSDPYDADRSRNPSRLVLPNGKLPTQLLSIHGHRVELKAVSRGGFSGLELTRAPEEIQLVAEELQLRFLDHYLAPTGSFELHVEKPIDQVRIGLGASNLESMTLMTGTGGDLITFARGPALVTDPALSAFRAADADRDGLNLTDLGAFFRTSWLNVPNGLTPSGASRLALDPEGMQGYAPAPGAMRFRPSRPALEAASIPWVPVLGLSSRPNAGADELRIERDCLSRARRRLMVSRSIKVQDESGRAALSDPDIRTTQGYALSRTTDGEMSRIVFGRTSSRNPDLKKIENPDFGLVPNSAQGERLLAQIMAANRLCIVTKLSKLIRYFEPESLQRVYMADWKVGWLKPDGTTDRDAFFILKHDNRSLKQLVQNSAQWSNQDGDLALNATEQAAALQRLRATWETNDPLYAPLRQRLERSDWNGLLLLDLDLAEMPKQLGALESLVGDDQAGAKLPVHHVGIDLSAIEDSGATEWKTSVFGLVDYKRDDESGFKPSDPETLQLRIKILQLLVENDAVRSFTSQVEAKIESFLDTKVRDPKRLTLFGRYESRVTETGERRDSYTFETRVPLVIPFDGDYFLDQVSISRVGLVTVVEGSEKQGKLLIDGEIKFGQIGAGLDLLGIDLIEFFDLGVTFGLRSGTFKLSVDYPSLRFDFDGFNRRRGRNKPRLSSFLSKLPIKLRGFRFGEFTLPKLGYFDMSGIGGVDLVPDFKMAFDFDVDLGSLGSLAKKLERFKLSLLAGWRPQTNGRPKLAFGFRIDVGEGAGGIDLGIEGVLRLTADRFRVAKAKSDDGRDLIFLAADNARLKVFSVELPSRAENLSFYLFAPMTAGAPFAENLGWYARLVDDQPEPPIALSQLALGQRIFIEFDHVQTVRQTLAWLEDQQEYQTDEDFARFAGAPNSILRYAPNREWFVALAGVAFEIVELQLLLRDSDLYGVYLALLGEDALSVDLFYQKLADGVGRYTAEIMLPADFRSLDLGAVAVTLGAIRVEVYTDGGFLIDLGFPEDVDYGRSFVVQGGPFIGKGGLYLGRVAREGMPSIPAFPTGKAFRAGFALRIGLGREVQKGPMSASLSVSVYGRFEGLIARRHDALAANGSAPALAGGSGYYVWIQGEVGIILEIEGRVDLKLIQAKLLVRAWVGAGVTFETGQPIVLHARLGVKISLEVVIGRIKIFGKTIKITVRVGYETELRYEWVLPARIDTLLQVAESSSSLPWSSGLLSDVRATPVPFDLRLLLDISRSNEGAAHAVLVPTAFLYDVPGSSDPHPLRTLGAALIELAVRQIGADPQSVYLCRTRDPDHGDDLDVQRLRAAVASLDSFPDPDLDALFGQLFPDATIDIAFGGTEADTPAPERAEAPPPEAFAFPIPPGLQLRIGGTIYDFAQIGMLSDADVQMIVDEISRQFAQTAEQKTFAPASMLQRPGVQHLFRSWCGLFALTTLDTLQNAWDMQLDRVQLAALLANWDWRTAARRSGRTFNSGLRVKQGTGSKALMDRVGLSLPLPAADAIISIEGVAAPWLSSGTGSLELLARNAALVGQAKPKIPCSVAEPAAIHVRRRSFLQPPWQTLKGYDGAEIALFNRFSEDFCGQVQRIASGLLPPLEHRVRKTNIASGQEVDELPLSARPHAATAFDMVCDLVPRTRELGGTTEFVEDCIQVSGSSEAERRVLDSLLGGPETEIQQRLAGARLYLALADANSSEGFEIVDAATPGIQLARASTSIERRPGFATAFASKAVEDDIFLADGHEAGAFLTLLQRAAIVNSSGTYLLLPPGSPLFQRFAGNPTLRLTVIVIFDPPAALPAHAVNGCALLDSSDRQVLRQTDGGKARRIATRALPDANPADQEPLFETVALREPGSVALRVFRPKPQAVAQSDPPTLAECEAHLASQFDMLEYGVEVGGQLQLAIDLSVPIASEEALPANATDAQRQDIAATLPSGADAGDLLRYDLVVPIWRARGLTNPYDAVDGKTHRITLGWRDLYGNRLGDIVQEVSGVCLYQDPLVPLPAWPSVRAWVSAGTKQKTLTANFAFMPEELTSRSGESSERARRLQALVHQLDGPGVTARLISSLGIVGTVPNLKSRLVQWLKAVLDSKAPPATLSIDVPVTIDRSKAHSEIALQLVIERETARCDPKAPSDVRTVTSPLPLRTQNARAEGRSASDEYAQIATEFFRCFPGYRAALGTNDLGGNSWWAVDERLIPAPTRARPIMYSQPPLARAPMSDTGVEYVRLGADGSKTIATTDASDVDVDEMMRSVLAKVDAFVAPTLAGRAALAEADPGKLAPFVRVMRAKQAMLAQQPDTLLRHVRPVFDSEDATRTPAARRAIREAMATQMARFHELASVAIQPLAFASDVPEDWFPTKGQEEAAPKLYGRLRFGGLDDQGDAARNRIRTLNHGIALRGRETELSFTILPPADQGGRIDAIDLTDQILFEVTHVEREVNERGAAASMRGRRGAAAPAPSRWLTFVPINNPQPLPVIDISRGLRVVAPAPLRQLPKPPALTRPEVTSASTAPLPNAYDAAVRAAKQWQFTFDLSGIVDPTDQACCRLVYNAGVGSESLPNVQSAAQPLFPALLRPLVAFEAAMAAAWGEIEAAAGEDIPAHFATACNIFADCLDEVVSALASTEFARHLGTIDEDRFVLAWKTSGTAVVAFVDHVPSSNGGKSAGSEPQRPPLAGDGAPMVRLAYSGRVEEKQITGPSYRSEFSLGGAIGAPFSISIRPLNAVRLQSIWSAASIRRNAEIDAKPLDSLFVYRTAEIFLQEALVPKLKVGSGIELGGRPSERLSQRLEAALVPIFDGAITKIPVQMQLGLESVRLAAVANQLSGEGFAPQPDPKLQLVGSVGSEDVADLAERLESMINNLIANEPIGRPEDVKLVLSTTLLSDRKQPLLEIARILIPLEGTSLIPFLAEDTVQPSAGRSGGRVLGLAALGLVLLPIAAATRRLLSKRKTARSISAA